MDESLYIATALSGASVINSFYDGLLIVIYSSTVEFYKIHKNALVLESSVSLNAKVSCASYLDSKLMILTEQCQLLILNKDQAINTLELKEPSGRPVDNGHLIITDPKNNIILCHMYQGLCRVIPLDFALGDQVLESRKGKRKAGNRYQGISFNVRLKELLIVDMVFLNNLEDPCLVILHQDNGENLHVISYTIDFENKSLIISDIIPETQVDQSTTKLIPLLGNMSRKVLAIGQNGFTLLPKEVDQGMVHQTDQSRMISAWEWMDNNTLIFVDYNANLEELKFGDIDDKMWIHKSNGVVSQATCLTKISENLVFVGSHYSDSQLISLNIEKNVTTLAVVDSITNLAPIIDFCLVDLDKRGQSQVVACCGAHKDGSLRIIRNGIGIEEIGELGDMNGINGLFTIRKTYCSKFDSIMAISFVAETRFQIMNEGVLEELENTNGLISHETTLLCANVYPNSIVQITPSSVYLINQKTLNCDSSWCPPNKTTIVTASANDRQIVLGISGGSIAYLEIENSELSPISHKSLKNEISSINISRFSEGASNYCAIGTWTDVGITILKLPSLEEVDCKRTSGDVIPRSILIAHLSNLTYLFIGLGDGTLVIYSFDIETGHLTESKAYTIGSQQIRLIPFSSNAMDCVLACSDHPSVIHSEGGKLRFANVNIKDLNYIVPFNTEFTPHALSYVTDETLKVGLIEQIQRIHIKTIPIGETAKKISHQSESHVFGILTVEIVSSTEERSSFKILDEHTYELLDTYKMEQHEMVQSLATISVDCDGIMRSFFIVGTAFVLRTEEEPNQGRMLVFEVDKFRKIILCYETETKGCVYGLCAFEKNMIVASVNSGVFLYKWEIKENDQIFLECLCSYHGYIVAVSLAVCGTFIIVGDLMKSVSVLTYDLTDNKIKEAYRDYATNYMTCVDAIDEDIFLGSDNTCNVFTLKRSDNASSDNHQLEESGQYHLGEMINQFRHGSLVLPISETDCILQPKIIYGTLNGSLGIIAKISKSAINLLVKLEQTMITHLKPVGGLCHNRWRTFLSERGHYILENRRFIDGDLIESYVDLDASMKEAIYEDIKDEIDSLDGLVKLIEEISRSH